MEYLGAEQDGLVEDADNSLFVLVHLTQLHRTLEQTTELHSEVVQHKLDLFP